jgi:hypothetical protein
MTYPELKSMMLLPSALADESLTWAISGLIDCYEAKGLTTDAAINELTKVLKTCDKYTQGEK